MTTTGAPSPNFEIPPVAASIFSKFIAAEYAYFTPKGDPLTWPVTPYWYPRRRVLAIATGLAYPNKADYPKLNPNVSLYFSDPTSSGMDSPPAVLVHAKAIVLDEDIQENTDRYVRELREKFGAAKIGLNPISVKLLDFYLPRLWVEMTPYRLLIYPSAGGDPEVFGEPISETPLKSARNGGTPSLEPEEARALQETVAKFGEAVVTIEGIDGFPMMSRSAVSYDDGWIELAEGMGAGRACLSFHRHTLGGVRFEAYMVRGTVVHDGSRSRFAPQRLVGFFGNGAVFPFSVIPEIASLRRRLKKELAKRDKPMPALRIP
ncbi:MAG: hypothetical protein KY429_10065 [Actinobacteria bacterium]|nr:hypothetical protein [Actinomycetota bacterium]